MTPIPWPLIGRPRATGGTVTPAPARGPAAAKDAAPPKPPKPPAWTPPYAGPTASPYPAPGHYLPPGAPLWLISEARVLASLATAGGDLTAHRTVHQEAPRG